MFKGLAGDIAGVVVNPGGWFGKVWLIQIAIGNSLNPFYAVEADHESDAIDEFADSRFSHLIDIDESDAPEDEDDRQRAGNDGHLVCLDNLHIIKAPSDLKYMIDWLPERDGLSSAIDSELQLERDAAG
jgi:hypothetical protein